jgi:hypothetical protein
MPYLTARCSIGWDGVFQKPSHAGIAGIKAQAVILVEAALLVGMACTELQYACTLMSGGV